MVRGSFAVLIMPLLPAAAAGHEPHSHGRATLALVADGTMLTAEFRTDQHTLVGFEGEPGNPRERALLDDVLQSLSAQGALYTIEGRQACQRTGDVGWRVAPPPGPLSSTAKQDVHGNAHTDYILTETLACGSHARIEKVTLRAFDALGSLERVDVTVLTDDQQGAGVATHDSPAVGFR